MFGVFITLHLLLLLCFLLLFYFIFVFLAGGPSSSMSRLNPANLSSWSVDDVCYWLISNGLGNFIDTFRDNEVDGECLLTLDNKLLRDDLGVTALGHRSKILKRVESLKKEIHPT